MADAKGKTIAITGCTSGTGFVAAQVCLEKGAKVIMLNRESERAVKAEAALRAAVPGCVLTQVYCDLMSFQSVREAAWAMNNDNRDSGLDVLINNAGIMAMPDEATSDGYDVQMQTNHLAHFLLTKELWPSLKRAASLRGEARVVNHSSLARTGVSEIPKENLMQNGGNLGGNGPARVARYCMSKLANVQFTLEMHRRLQAADIKDIKVLCAAPGIARTELAVGTTASFLGFRLPQALSNMPLAQSAEDGTIPLLLCALDSKQEKFEKAVGGDFWEPACFGGMWGPPTLVEHHAANISDPEACKRLWQYSEQAVGEFNVQSSNAARSMLTFQW